MSGPNVEWAASCSRCGWLDKGHANRREAAAAQNHHLTQDHPPALADPEPKRSSTNETSTSPAEAD